MVEGGCWYIGGWLVYIRCSVLGEHFFCLLAWGVWRWRFGEVHACFHIIRLCGVHRRGGYLFFCSSWEFWCGCEGHFSLPVAFVPCMDREHTRHEDSFSFLFFSSISRPFYNSLLKPRMGRAFILQVGIGDAEIRVAYSVRPLCAE